MSLTRNELLYLMAYVDGQVDDDELPEVTALLERSEEARQIVAQHAALGDWVRESREGHAAEAGADRIAGRVLAEIEQLGGGKIIEIERVRAKAALNRQRVKEFGALALVAGIAAAFLLAPAKEPEPLAAREPTLPPTAVRAPVAQVAPGPSATGDDVQPSEPAPTPSAAVATATDPDIEGGGGVEVQSVESPSPFSIFQIPAATGLNPHSASVVVWIDE